MPFIKQELVESLCNNIEHNPPTMLYQLPGTYTWQCPQCGQETTYTIPIIS